MTDSTGKPHASRHRRFLLRAWALLGLWTTVAVSAAFAEPGDFHWKSDSELYLTGMSNFRQTQSGFRSFNTIAVTGELTFSHAARPYYGGFFADYRSSNSDLASNSTNIGAYFRYNFSDWDATSWLFASKPDSAAESWIYAGRLRYRVAQNHKVGIEVSSRLSRFDSPAFAVGYYGSLSESLSLNVITDPGVRAGSDFAARMELVWKIR